MVAKGFVKSPKIVAKIEDCLVESDLQNNELAIITASWYTA